MFAPNESPYFAMFRCGCMGIPVEQCITHCTELGVPLREKDVRSWTEGEWNYKVRRQASVLNPMLPEGGEIALPITESTLDDFKKWPPGWNGSERRWFPCNEQNMPMQKWGYAPGFSPTLYEREVAKSLSPIRWVGQNLYAQPFVVFDIDGVGHGHRDDQVIEFGNRYRDFTETWENPSKPGSFHLYFSTEYQIPIGHFAYAKLDIMGNQKNAAVYTKDKQSNGKPRARLTEATWSELKQYIAERRAQREGLR